MTAPGTSTEPAQPAATSLVRQAQGRYGVPYVRTQLRVLGEAQIRVFEALCRLRGRRPHELAADLVLQAVRKARFDPEVQAVVAEISTELADPSQGPWCRICGCTQDLACIGGCAWVPDPLLLGELCSSCRPHVAQTHAADVGEATAIADLLAYLPHADAAELLELARTCPAAHVADYALQAADLLEGLRAELTAVVSAAHDQAQAAEAWIVSLEGDDAPDGPLAPVIRLGVASDSRTGHPAGPREA